ncbi:unnamed protein product [Prorocentrum cordatum]|uniref:Uncharacterized protein n=1 Tax=Prorocentrum cordatum TaxID=2364126 RepID=A0ABN9U0Q2_9DINO|nr:unnamed protein product [Polarella glacialis]
MLKAMDIKLYDVATRQDISTIQASLYNHEEAFAHIETRVAGVETWTSEKITAAVEAGVVTKIEARRTYGKLQHRSSDRLVHPHRLPLSVFSPVFYGNKRRAVGDFALSPVLAGGEADAYKVWFDGFPRRMRASVVQNDARQVLDAMTPHYDVNAVGVTRNMHINYSVRRVASGIASATGHSMERNGVSFFDPWTIRREPIRCRPGAGIRICARHRVLG